MSQLGSITAEKEKQMALERQRLSLIHISEPTRP